MGLGLLAFAAGLGSGYLQGKQRNLDQQVLEEERAMRRTAFENQQDEVTRLKRDRASLADAGKLATVNPDGAVLSLADGTQTAYGDAGVANSDFRMLRNAEQAPGGKQILATTPIPAVPATPDQPASLADGTMPQAPQSAPVVNNKAYGTLADANTAAAELNTPEAIVARQAAALNAMGQPEKAAALVAGAKQAKLTDYQLSTAQTNHLNELANQKISDRAASNGGDWIKTQADILTETAVGGLAGAKAAPRLSADGKTVQIVLTRPDGTEKVVRQYGNDDQGQMRAQQDLMRVNPTVKMQWLHERSKDDQKAKLDESVIGENKAKTNYYNSFADQKSSLAKGGNGDKPYKMNEDDKILFQSVNTAVHDADKAVGEAMSKLMPGDDPTKAPGVVYAQNRLKASKLNQFKTHVNLGVITPEQLANDIMGAAKTLPEVYASLSQLHGSVGPDAAEQVAAQLQTMDTYKAMATNSPPVKWKDPAMNPAPSPKSAPAKPSLANPAEPPKPAPATTASAIDVAGAKLDKAREDLKVIQQGQRPGLAQGRTAIDSYGSKLTEAKKKVDQLEREYQSLIPKQTAAFVGQK